MGGGVDVETNAVIKAAKEIESAAAGVNRGDPHSDVDKIADALPGSSSAGAASTLQSKWKTRFSDWERDAETQGTELRASASTYDETDLGTQRNMGNYGRRPELI